MPRAPGPAPGAPLARPRAPGAGRAPAGRAGGGPAGCAVPGLSAIDPAGRACERGRPCAGALMKYASSSPTSEASAGSSSPSSRRSPISSASAIDRRIASSAAIAGSSLRVEASEAACLAVAAASARSATIAWPAAFRPARGRARPDAALASGRLAAPRAAPPLLRPPRRAADRFTLARLRTEEDPPGIELLADDPDLVRPGGRRLDQVPRHLHVPADVLLDLLQRDAGVDRDQHHLARLGIEAV